MQPRRLCYRPHQGKDEATKEALPSGEIAKGNHGGSAVASGIGERAQETQATGGWSVWEIEFSSAPEINGSIDPNTCKCLTKEHNNTKTGCSAYTSDPPGCRVPPSYQSYQKQRGGHLVDAYSRPPFTTVLYAFF